MITAAMSKIWATRIAAHRVASTSIDATSLSRA
jgi:hypothetical protein